MKVISKQSMKEAKVGTVWCGGRCCCQRLWNMYNDDVM